MGRRTYTSQEIQGIVDNLQSPPAHVYYGNGIEATAKFTVNVTVVVYKGLRPGQTNEPMHVELYFSPQPEGGEKEGAVSYKAYLLHADGDEPVTTLTPVDDIFQISPHEKVWEITEEPNEMIEQRE